MLKALLCLLLTLLTIYAPMELTRMIYIGEIQMKLHPDTPVWEWWLELGIIWLLYSAAVIIWCSVINKP